MGKANFMNSRTLTTKRLRSTYMSMLQKYLHFQGNATFIYICRRSMTGIGHILQKDVNRVILTNFFCKYH